MKGGRWRVDELTLTTDARRYGRAAHYRYHVEGVNTETGERFSWSVPDVSDPSYDLSGVCSCSCPPRLHCEAPERPWSRVGDWTIAFTGRTQREAIGFSWPEVESVTA